MYLRLVFYMNILYCLNVKLDCGDHRYAQVCWFWAHNVLQGKHTLFAQLWGGPRNAIGHPQQGKKKRKKTQPETVAKRRLSRMLLLTTSFRFQFQSQLHNFLQTLDPVTKLHNDCIPRHIANTGGALDQSPREWGRNDICWGEFQAEACFTNACCSFSVWRILLCNEAYQCRGYCVA